MKLDENIDFLFLVGALRDDAAEEDLRARFPQTGDDNEYLKLAGLSGEHITTITTETLKCDHQRAEPLAQILMDKTRGNPFFLAA